MIRPGSGSMYTNVSFVSSSGAVWSGHCRWRIVDRGPKIINLSLAIGLSHV
jgi:hypothetical protein